MCSMAISRERSAFAAAVAAQLRAERAASGLTQAEVSKRSGIPFGTYRRLEDGDRVMDTAHLGRLQDVFGLSVQEFIARAERRAAATADPLSRSAGTEAQ